MLLKNAQTGNVRWFYELHWEGKRLYGTVYCPIDSKWVKLCVMSSDGTTYWHPEKLAKFAPAI